MADQPPPQAGASLGASAVEWAGLLLFPAMGAAALALLLGRGWQRLPLRPRYETTLTPPLGLGLMLGMLMAPMLVVPFLDRSTYGSGENPAAREQIVLMSGAYAAQMIVVLVWIVMDQRRPIERSLRTPRAILIGAGALILYWPMMLALATVGGLLSELGTGETPDPLAHETLRMLADGPPDAWEFALIGLVVVVTPIVEEVMYRGILQGTLRAMGLGPWTAISITSVIFAAMHFGAVLPHALPALFVLSLGFGWAVEKSGRVAASIVMHMLFNAGNVLATVLLT